MKENSDSLDLGDHEARLEEVSGGNASGLGKVLSRCYQMWVWVSSLEWMKLSHVVFGNSYVIFIAFVEVLLAHAHVLYALLSGQTFVL